MLYFACPHLFAAAAPQLLPLLFSAASHLAVIMVEGASADQRSDAAPASASRGGGGGGGLFGALIRASPQKNDSTAAAFNLAPPVAAQAAAQLLAMDGQQQRQQQQQQRQGLPVLKSQSLFPERGSADVNEGVAEGQPTSASFTGVRRLSLLRVASHTSEVSSTESHHTVWKWSGGIVGKWNKLIDCRCGGAWRIWVTHVTFVAQVEVCGASG